MKPLMLHNEQRAKKRTTISTRGQRSTEVMNVCITRVANFYFINVALFSSNIYIVK